MSYTVKILDSKEFDKLPFKRAKEALGAADAKTGIAYVRDTGYNDVTKHTIEHELDELMQKVSPHEEDGIRYKIPILGPIFSGLGKVGGAVASGIGKGAASLGNFLTPGPEIFGAAAKGASSAAAPTLSGALSGASAPLSSKGGLGFTSSLPGFSGAGEIASGGLGQAASGGSGGIFSNFGSGISSLARGAGNVLSGILPGGPPGTAGAPINFPGFPGMGGGGNFPSFPQSQPSFLDTIFSGAGNLLTKAFAPQQPSGGDKEDDSVFGKFKNAAPGLLLPLLGNLFAGDVEAPDFSGVTDPLRKRITGEDGFGSDAFNLGFGEAERVIGAPLDEVPEEVFGQSEKIRDQQLADDVIQLRNQFKALNPTADVENNSAFLREKSRLEERAREDKANARASLSFEHTQQQLARRLDTMQTLLNLDSAQTEQLIRLAQLDVSEILTRTGIEVEEANQIKQLFGDFGQILLRNQFPGQQQQEIV